MKPGRLVMKAFGPYGKREVIDFSELGARRRFLVHGPTGSGKSTILDAICFALYGEASGDDRAPAMMRSDHAPIDVKTEVILDFSIGEHNYRVSRSPEQERPKKRGEGTTTLRPTATLWSRGQGAAQDEDGEVIAHQWKKVTKEVETLLGFKVGQFRQVVILPQGQFRRLLTARSAERQAIMEALFHTEAFRRIEERLKLKARGLSKALQDIDAQRQIILDQSSSPTVEALCQTLASCRAQAAAFERDRSLKQAAAGEARAALAQGRAVDLALTQHQARLKTIEVLQARAPAVEIQRQKLKLARRAAKVLPIDEAAIEGEKKAREAGQQRDALTIVASEAQRHCSAAERELDGALARELDRAEAEKSIERLDALEAKVRELDAARRTSDAMRSVHEDAELTLKRAEEELEEVGVLEETLREGRAAALIEASRVADLSGALERARERLDARIRIDALSVSVKEVKREVERDSRALSDAEASLAQERRELAMIERAWFDGQAAILAADLSEGEACPVCGSTEHPHPASVDGAVEREETVELKKEKVQRHSELALAARLKADESRSAASIKETQFKTLVQSFSETPVLRFVLDAQVESLETALNTAKEASARLAELDGRIKEVEARRGRAAQSRKLLDMARDKAAEDSARALAVLRERRGLIPADLGTQEALQKRRGELRSTLAALNKMLADAEGAAARARARVGQAQADLNTAQGALDNARQQSNEARDKLHLSLKQELFETEARYRAALSSPESIEELDEMVHDFEGQLSAARVEVQRSAKIADGLIKPDVEALALREDQARMSHEEALRQEAASVAALDHLIGQKKLLDSLTRKSEKTNREYAVYGRLAQVAGGKNELRMTFQRFVLTTLLDEVLECASQRLRTMSNKRFDLRRSRGLTDARAAGGLEIEVLDHYTGTHRNVVTLSGGESFLAALSMALGLADVVQSHAGGIRLETIFVDEGFGSLDAEAVDHALNALLDLQAGGRLVGIISHVDELKERVHTRLAVRRGPKGSTTAFET